MSQLKKTLFNTVEDKAVHIHDFYVIVRSCFLRQLERCCNNSNHSTSIVKLDESTTKIKADFVEFG